MKAKINQKSLSKVLFASILVIASLTAFSVEEEEIAIEVAPNVLNLNNSGEWVTIHTDIPYYLVDKKDAVVTLNGIPIAWSKADNQGNFVAKFAIGEVKDLFDEDDLPGSFLLTLDGKTILGDSFYGEHYITVIEVIPAGKK